MLVAVLAAWFAFSCCVEASTITEVGKSDLSDLNSINSQNPYSLEPTKYQFEEPTDLKNEFVFSKSSVADLLNSTSVKVFLVATFLGENFLLAATASGISMHLILDGKVEETEFVKLPIYSTLKQIDYLEVFDNEGVWVLQGSVAGSLLLSKLDHLDENLILRPKILDEELIGLRLVNTDGRINILTIQKNSTGNVKLAILSGDNLHEISTISLALSNVDQIEVEYIGNTALFFIRHKQTVLLYAFTSSDENLKFVEKFENFDNVATFILHDILHLVLIKNDDSIKISPIIDLVMNNWAKTEPLSGQFEYALGLNYSGVPMLILANDQEIRFMEAEGSFETKLSIPLDCGLVSIEATSSSDVVTIGVHCKDGTPLLFIIRESKSKVSGSLEMKNIEENLNEYDNFLRKQRLNLYKMKKILDLDALMMADSDQTWNGQISLDSVEVEGQVKAQRFSKQMSESSYEFYNSNMIDLRRKTLELESLVSTFESSLSTLLYFEGDQKIDYPVKIHKLSASRAHIFSGQIDKVNDLKLSEFSEFLHLTEDQVIRGDVHFKKMIIENADIYSFTDGEKVLYPTDFLQSNKENQVVTGHHEFNILDVSGDVLPAGTSTEIEVNGIKTSDVILKDSDVEFKDTKTFAKEFVVKEKLDIENLNGHDYDSLWDSAIRISNNNLFLTSAEVQGDLTVDGRVKVTSVNGLDLAQVENNTIKYSKRDQIINGPIVFRGDVQVQEDMIVERINGIEWDSLLRSEDSLIQANIAFKKAFVTGSLHSDNINGMDLDKEAVLTNVDQVIEGNVIFMKNVIVSGPHGVSMEDGSTINGIDLSEETALSANQSVITGQVEVPHLELNCDLEVKTIHGRSMISLDRDYWKKSKPQTISQSFSLEQAIFKNSLYASFLNNIKPHDYLRVDEDQTISGNYYFHGGVNLVEIKMSPGTKIDGVDLNYLKSAVVNLHEPQVILGQLNFNHVKIMNLYASSDEINGINIRTDLLHGQHQNHAGSVTFKNLISTDELVVRGALTAEHLNGKKSTDFFQDTKNSIKEILGDLILDNVEVENVDSEGLFNRISLSDLFQKSARKNADSTQHFSGRVVVEDGIDFLSSLHFESLNGKNWNEFLSEIANKDDVIEHITFYGPVIVAGNMTSSSINQLDLSSLASSLLSRSKDQVVESYYNFTNGIVAVDVKTPSISGVPIYSILLTDEPAVLRGVTKFSGDVLFNSIHSPHSWVNGCNLNSALSPGQLDMQHLLSRNVTLGHLRVKGNLTKMGKLLSGRGNFELFDLLSRVVLKSSEQFITGAVQVEEAYTKKLSSVHSINNVLWEDILKSLADSSKKLLKCDLEFNSTVEAEIVRANSFVSRDLTLNGIKLSDVISKGVKKNHTGLILGRKYFTGDLFIGRNLETTELNGIKVADLIALDGTNPQLGNEIFFKELFVTGNINTKVLKYGSKPGNLLEELKEDIFAESFVKNRRVSMHVKGNLFVEEINGINLDDVIVSNKDYQIITGRKNFSTLLIEGPVFIDTFNSIPLKTLLLHDFETVPTDSLAKIEQGYSLPVETATLLRTAAIKTDELNTLSTQYTDRMYQKLLSISEVANIPLPGTVQQHIFKISSIVTLCITVERSVCPLTHRIEIKGSEFYEEEHVDGVYIPIGLSSVNEIFDFYQGCSMGKYNLTIARQLKVKDKLSAILTRAYLDLGSIKKAKAFSTLKNDYFLILSKKDSSENNSTDSIYVLEHADKFELIWEKSFKSDEQITDFDLMESNGYWNLGLIVDKAVGDTEEIESKNFWFRWDEYNHRFTYRAAFSDGTRSTSILFAKIDEELSLFVGQKGSTVDSCTEFERQRNVKVLRRNKGKMEAVTSLPVHDVSSLLSFTVDDQLFIVVSSKDGLKIFEKLQNEDFELIKKWPTESISSIVYYRQFENHYLSLLARNKGLEVLELKFGGLSKGNINI